MDFNWLTIILFLPALGAIIIALFGKSARAAKGTAAVFTFIPLALAIYLFITFDRSAGTAGAFQFEENYLWIAPLNAYYHLGVDGLSLPLLLLTTFLGFLAVLISWKVHERPREYFAWLLLLETSILGVFVSLDLLLFFIFWEIEVIPMYFLISIWGTGRKEYSAIKYVIYTLFGSAFMLAGILSLYFHHQQPEYGRYRQPGAGHGAIDYAGRGDFLPAVHRLCRQAAGVPAAYLAAGRPYRRPHRASA